MCGRRNHWANVKVLAARVLRTGRRHCWRKAKRNMAVADDSPGEIPLSLVHGSITESIRAGLWRRYRHGQVWWRRGWKLKKKN